MIVFLRHRTIWAHRKRFKSLNGMNEFTTHNSIIDHLILKKRKKSLASFICLFPNHLLSALPKCKELVYDRRICDI